MINWAKLRVAGNHERFVIKGVRYEDDRRSKDLVDFINRGRVYSLIANVRAGLCSTNS
jgi:hypothetical protein